MIKYLFFLFPLILLASPDWFYHLETTNKNEIIGYGVDKTLSQAKENALADIVKSISVSVESSTNISKNATKNTFNNSVSSRVKTQAQGVLSGTEMLQAEEYNHLWYVAVKYDNAPLEIKLKKLLPLDLVQEEQNKYLKNTALFKGLNHEIGKALNYKIVRKSNLWHIQYQDTLLPLTQNNFYELFSNQKNKTIKMIANKHVYVQNDEMYFDISLAKPGYVSILYVEHNGKVGVLLSNKWSDKSFPYPNMVSEEKLKIVNPYNKVIQELYLVVYSKKPIDLAEFENVSENLLDESNYNFNQLIDKLNEFEFSTYTIKIRK